MITAVRGNTKQKSWAVMAKQSATESSSAKDELEDEVAE
jgi:hypothetical protein